MKWQFYLFLLIFSFNSSYSNWERLTKPGDYRKISNLEVSNNEIYITLRDNIFYTSNFGKDWKQINDASDYLFNEVKGIIKNNNIFFAYCINGSVLFPQKYYKTSNNGIDWMQVNSGIRPKKDFFTKFCKNQDEIFAINSSYIYKLDSSGTNWQIPYDTTKFLPWYNNTLMIFNNKMFIGREVSKQTLENGVIPQNVNIYSMENKSWYVTTDTLSGIWKYTINSFEVIDSTIYAGTTGGIFISTDEGIHWKLKSEGLKNSGVLQLIVKDNLFYALVRYLGRNYLSYSLDKGENWLFNDNVESYPEPVDIKLSTDKLIIATIDGLYSSSDTLEIITSLLDTVLCGNAALDLYVDNNKLFTGIAFGNLDGIYETSDFGNNWIFKENNLFNVPITKIAVKDNFIFICSNYLVSHFSSDFGKTFKVITQGMGLPYPQVFAIKIINDIVYVGTRYGIFYSKDWGTTWSELNGTLGNSLIFSIECFGEYMFAGTQNNILWISSDKGANWTKSTIPFKDYTLDIRDIKVMNDKLFAATTHTPNADSWWGKGVWVSNDFGITWEEKNNGIPNYLGVQSFETYENYIFAGLNRNGGIYFSTDYGENWQSHNKGFTNFMINKLIIKNNYLFAATSGGVYRAKLSDFGIVSVDEIEVKPDYLWTSAPYPNPAKEFVKAKIYWDTNYDIEQAEISIYDMYGTKIGGKDKISLVPENEYSGIIKWDCSGISNGIYLITIHHGTKKQNIKVCVVK